MCYPVGTKVQISYTADNPADGHALFKILNTTLFFYIGGSAMLLVSGLLFYTTRKSRRQRIAQ